MTHQPSENRTILVVEDDYFIAEALRDALEEDNWHILGPFPCISKALQALDEGKCADVAVLDVNLNGERVYPLLDRLMLEDMPIVLMTGYESNTIPSTYTRLPCLRKPAPMQQLIDCVNKLLAT